MNKPVQKKTKRRPDYLVIIVSLLLMIGVFYFIRNAMNPVYEAQFNEIETAVNSDHIEYFEYIAIGGDNLDTVRVNGKFREEFKSLYENKVSFTIVMRLDDADEFLKIVASYDGTTTKVDVKSGVSFWSVLFSLLPIIISVLILIFIFKSASGGNNKAFDFGKNRAKLSRGKSVTFKDVAGSIEEKEELAEIVDFLKNPKKYHEIGARIPKGVLLVGSPGTGKTLLARAVAGEADVPFFTISGSDFVEMFVGVGASRVRDLFKIAKESSPCIIFIDEIDAVGRQRGAGLGGGHDEREQTLNQLLVEMDGFSANQNIIIIAATNRPDVLDPALLRPGRFDRQIMIDLPDVKDREAILYVHARNKKIGDDVNFKHIAQRIPGFSGADIENLLNEAALLAARENRVVISEKDLDEAMDRVRMGPAKKSRKYSEHEKRVVAYHEAGHAVIGIKLEHANVVQKVTIIPRGQAGGYNLMMPAEETFLQTKDQLLHTITGYLGGRVAEEIEFDSITTGAYNDFEMATKIARAMVTEYGMSDLGPVQYESRGQNVFLGRDYFNEKNFSDQVAHEIDKEVRNIINGCLADAKRIILENKDLLDAISNYLIKVETLTKSDIDEIVKTGKLAWAEKETVEEVTTVEQEEETKEETNEN
ncbi:ATP-dependent zinc metalloprotease FtsH [Haploplasma modicum]|uniref:ATP-dependent zinc metalloprotease FtsH n=1 Tax=Haploplasma modicum TaxID=2150 RepID=UPI00214B3DF2|nr:ATP-dependent zinc metalloprotease FtsH [Haploplasma modicum]MCR1809186.1 ATP-dependent zinc metalloprotease FtsH [Haploplasma modicum]